MDRAKKKAKQRLQRQRKRKAIRSERSAGVAKAFADGELVACYMNDDWRERGQAVPFVLRRARDGRLAMATFIVDLWCAGLKDAWGVVGLSLDEFEDHVDVMSGQLDDTIADATLAEVAAVVAGAVRFARQNGFRLPPHFDRWTALLGSGYQPDSADLSAFGVDEEGNPGGKNLRWVGPLRDLRARLIGSTVEQFLARADVEAVTDADMDFDDVGEFGDFGENEGDDDDATPIDPVEAALRLDEDYDATVEALDEMVDRASLALRRWCMKHGKVPEAKVDDALPLVIARGFTSIAQADADDPEALATVDAVRDQEAQFLDALAEPERVHLTLAIAQVEEFLKDIKTPEQMVEAFGPPPDDDEP